MTIFAYAFVLRYLLQFFSIILSKLITELCTLTYDRKSDLRMNNKKCIHKTYKIYVVVVLRQFGQIYNIVMSLETLTR